jgi:hypothetical protein
VADKLALKAEEPCNISSVSSARHLVLRSFKKDIHFEGALNCRAVCGAVQEMGTSAST